MTPVSEHSEYFHWTKDILPETASLVTFQLERIMRIGAAVSINEECIIDEFACRRSSFCALQSLSTNEGFWETLETRWYSRGQDLVAVYNQTWRKVPGVTLKQRLLQQPDDWPLIHFLDQSCGLQVSFCTSVARRVSLRNLVADLAHMFVNPLQEHIWRYLHQAHCIEHVFRLGDLFAWLKSLPSDLQDYVLKLVRTVLERLQHTGPDRQNKSIVVAWPQPGDTERGLMIPCQAQASWAQVIADAKDCVTFA